MRRYLLFLVLILTGMPGFSQQRFTSDGDNRTLFPTKYETFEKYAFVLNGKIIEQRALRDYPGAKLNNIFPYIITLEGQNYPGALYFHIQERYAPGRLFANDPAYFINGVQVSPFDIHSSKVEQYNRIEKSEKDTIIDGRLYKGSLHVDTDEDFFAKHIALPEIIRKYTKLPLESVIVHWRRPIHSYSREADIGTIIQDQFPIYHIYIDTATQPISGLRSIEVDRIQFAEGERYVVHLLDDSHRWGSPFALGYASKIIISKNPLAVDTDSPCYIAKLDTTVNRKEIFTSVELNPTPYGGAENYLKKLSHAMELTGETSTEPTIRDSILVRSIVLKDGKLAELEISDSARSAHKQILKAIKKHSCLWRAAIQGGRPLIVKQKLTIFYNKNRSGKILALTGIQYWHNEVRRGYRYDIDKEKQ